jgi:hypothetical protein
VEIAGKYDEAASRIELLEELLAEALTQYEYRREERSKVSGTRRQP